MGVRVRRHKGQYYLFVNLGNRRKAHPAGTDRRVADSAAAKLRKAILRGEYRIPDAAPRSDTFAELARDWLARYPLTHAVKPATMENYESATRHHLLPHFGAMRLAALAPPAGLVAVEDFIAAKLAPGGSVRFRDRPLAPQSLRIALVALRLILQRAVALGLVPANPVAGLTRLPRRDTEGADPFTPAELRAILAAADALSFDFGTLLRLWVQGGLRSGEVAGLQEQDVDVTLGTVEVRRTYSRGRLGPPKRGRPRRVSILHPVTEETAEWRPGVTPTSRDLLARLARRKVAGLAPTAFLFGRGDRPRSNHDLERQWRRTLLAAGVRYRAPEQLRHSFASILLSRNAPPLYVAEAGGWASAAVLFRVYARWLPSQAGVAPVAPQVSATQAQPGRRVSDKSIT